MHLTLTFIVQNHTFLRISRKVSAISKKQLLISKKICNFAAVNETNLILEYKTNKYTNKINHNDAYK